MKQGRGRARLSDGRGLVRMGGDGEACSGTCVMR